MTEIYAMTQGHKYWNKTNSLAANCSWKAGPYLAEKMQKNEFAEWERVFAACVDGKKYHICYGVNRSTVLQGGLTRYS